MSEPPVALFDLDGVLTHADTTTALIVRRLRRRPLRLAVAVPLALLRLACPVRSGARAGLGRALTALALRGLGPDDYRTLAAEEGRRLAGRPGFRTRPAEQAVLAARRDGRAVVVTAAETALVTAYLDAAGLTGLPVLASTYDFRAGRIRFAPHNIGAAKVDAVRAAGLDPGRATFYTDSLTDLPLARRCARTVLVNASARTARRARASLGDRLEVVHWD